MDPSKSESTIRLWPGVVIALFAWLGTFVPGWVAPATLTQALGMVGGPVLGLLALLLWWGLASRAPKRDRLLGVGAVLVLLVVTMALAHPSAPMMVMVYGIPAMITAFVVCVALTHRWPDGRRGLALLVTLLVALGGWTLVRSDGVDGHMAAEFAWRWQSTAEERSLASLEGETMATVPTLAPAAESVAWPGFRGAERDGVLHGASLATDWEASPPEELWRRPVGPGWSSFALGGGLLYTQEQRGEEELVTAYRTDTGEPVWQHRDTARFWEAMAGPGPRATPTLADGRVYALGATGLLNALDAASGSPLWQRDIAADSGAPIPEWGFSSSPLRYDDLVVVHSGAPGGKAVVAYDAATGEPRWFAPGGALSYSSLHPAHLGGVDQLLLLTGDGISAHAPNDGSVLWEHGWLVPASGSRAVQPAITPEGGILLGSGFGLGLRHIQISKQGDGWQVEERWTSRRLKPYYNDFVVHRDHVYGFDNRILACIDLAGGEKAWKGGRYGNGQLVLLADQDLLLVLSDRGVVALVEAKPDGFAELVRFEAIDGKTWNHPVLAEGVLYVRNGEEMAAFRMATQTATASVGSTLGLDFPPTTPDHHQASDPGHSQGEDAEPEG